MLICSQRCKSMYANCNYAKCFGVNLTKSTAFSMRKIIMWVNDPHTFILDHLMTRSSIGRISLLDDQSRNWDFFIQIDSWHLMNNQIKSSSKSVRVFKYVGIWIICISITSTISGEKNLRLQMEFTFSLLFEVLACVNEM